MSQHASPEQPTSCPGCAAEDTEVIEDVSDEVTVYGCSACGLTWAQRRDPAD